MDNQDNNPTPAETDSSEQKQPEQGKKKRAKKTLTPKQNRIKTCIISVVVAGSCAALGCFGGYKLYYLKHPVHEKINIVIDNPEVESAGVDSNGNVDPYASIKKSLTADTVETDYASKAYFVVNYACYLQASSPYALTVGKGTVNASGVTQSIASGTYSSPEEIFNQNISSSSLVHTACRYYDKKDGNVTAYECSVPSDWQKEGIQPSHNYTYDSFIQAYGKLQKGQYYATTTTASTEAPVPEKYLTDSKDEYEKSTEASKHLVNAVLIYAIGSSTVKAGTIAKNDDGYAIDLTLDPATATSYYKVQMKTTGGLAKLPPFSSTEVSFQLNKDLTLKSSVFKDSYKATVSIFDSNATSTVTQYYFRSDTSTFTSQDKTIEAKIPEIADGTFNLLDMYPNA
jgi:hypothetical protein